VAKGFSPDKIEEATLFYFVRLGSYTFTKTFYEKVCTTSVFSLPLLFVSADAEADMEY